MGLFGKKKERPVFDITQKPVRTWLGGTKMVPTTKAEQKTFRELILASYPDAIIIDSAEKKRRQTDWIDEIEEFEAFMDD
jgi:hypothetical protein